MKFSLIATVATLASLSSAFDVGVTFYGANDQKFGMSFSTDAGSVAINNPLVVNRVTSPGGGFCTLIGADGATVVFHGQADEAVDPPQRFIRGSCGNA